MHHLTKRPQSGRHVVRGDLYKVADIPEVANFQFNTDQHPMTLDKQFQTIFHGTVSYSDVTFVQLNTMTLHIHAGPVKHPLSRVIATCDVQIPNHARKILERAKSCIDRRPGQKEDHVSNPGKDTYNVYAGRPHPAELGSQ